MLILTICGFEALTFIELQFNEYHKNLTQAILSSVRGDNNNNSTVHQRLNWKQPITNWNSSDQFVPLALAWRSIKLYVMNMKLNKAFHIVICRSNIRITLDCAGTRKGLKLSESLALPPLWKDRDSAFRASKRPPLFLHVSNAPCTMYISLQLKINISQF